MTAAENLAWRQARSGKITASNFQKVLTGKARAHATLARKIIDDAGVLATGVLPPEIFAPALTWGKENEPRARALYSIRTGTVVEAAPFSVHADHPLIGASPDGYVSHDGLIEIKCPYNHEQHGRYATLGPGAVMAQMQGQMWVTEREWCDFVSYDPRERPGLELFVQRVYFDAEYLAMMAPKIIAFADLLRSMTDGDEPTFTDHNTDSIVLF